MREVKYRAKVLNSKNWIYRQPFHIRGTWYMYNSLWDKVPINYKTLGQCTGLKDKNGKEIYEGDIIQDSNGKIYKIVWGVNSNGFIAHTKETHGNVYSSYHLAPKTVIVGNIHDNPELLEQSS